MNGFLSTLVLALVVFSSTEIEAQPRFGVEVSAGQGGGLTSYIDNSPYAQDDSIFLANEIAGTGLSLGLAFIFDDLELTLSGQLFDRSRVSLHHVANEPGPLPDDRIRPDGTIDDSGFTYREISTTAVTVGDRSRGDLLMSSVSGGWRYFILSGDVDIWVPIAGGISVAHVLEDTRPWVFGVTASTGIGLTFEIASPISIFVQTRVHGVLTPSYGPQQDAARTSASVGESTLEAATASMLYSSFGIGLQVAIR